MATKKTTNKKAEKGPGIGTVFGVGAALAAGAAAGYFLYGPKGKENRTKVKAWTLKAKAEVLEELENMKEVTENAYRDVVDTVTARYAQNKKASKADIANLNTELKRYWKQIQKDVAPAKKKVAKKTTKKRTTGKK